VVVTTFEVEEWLRKNSGGDAHDMVVVVPFARKMLQKVIKKDTFFL
jgi:hypothetical protein